ncbi:hypothetical protein NEIPOLOT_00686 [Neisseria polysaccharea ATCC 43768]|nr:hypothetical protein NEIPOLOT_00686 [Neisseria polysaccharea ATCC 43768]
MPKSADDCDAVCIGTKSYKERNFGYWFFRRHRFRMKPYPKFVYGSA